MKKYQLPKQIAGFKSTIYPGCSEDIRDHVSYRGQMVGLVNASKEVEFFSSALENALGKKLLPANLIGNLPADGIVRVVTKVEQDTLLDSSQAVCLAQLWLPHERYHPQVSCQSDWLEEVSYLTHFPTQKKRILPLYWHSLDQPFDHDRIRDHGCLHYNLGRL
jgi:hypothetical protein